MLTESKDQKIKWVNKTKRLCNCESNHLNCLTAKEWLKSMIGIWEFSYKKEDIRDKSIHPAVFPIDLARKVISLYTHKGEIVLDPFNGVGTTLLACKQLKRHGIGFDLNSRYCKTAKKRVLSQKSLDKYLNIKPINIEIINKDSRKILDYLPKNSIDLSFTSPPYADLLNKKRSNTSYRYRENFRMGRNEQYSQNENDLGTLKKDDFFKAFKEIGKKVHTVLKDGKRFVINMMDVRPHFFALPNLKEALEPIGFKLKNIIIWDKRDLVNNTGIFGWPSNYITLNNCYEYIFEFIKG